MPSAIFTPPIRADVFAVLGPPSDQHSGGSHDVDLSGQLSSTFAVIGVVGMLVVVAVAFAVAVHLRLRRSRRR